MSTARKIPFEYTKQIYKIFRSNDFIKNLILGVSILAEFLYLSILISLLLEKTYKSVANHCSVKGIIFEFISDKKSNLEAYTMKKYI